jgi:hypothetical protein
MRVLPANLSGETEMQFQKGQSGNPNGRPPGSRNKRTIAAEKLFDENAEKLTETVIDLAKDKNIAALRICMDRVCPPSKDRPTPFELPQIGAAADGVTAMARLVQAVADGDLSATEAAELAKMVQSYSQTVKNAGLEQRVANLEVRADQIEKTK